MSEENNIKKGGLAEKMAGYTPEPPEGVWEGVSAQIQGGNSRKRLLILLSTAAGLALAITVGISLLNSEQPEILVSNTYVDQEDATTDAKETIVSTEISQERRIPVLADKDIKANLNSKVARPLKEREHLEDKVIQTMHEVIQQQQKADEVIVAQVDPYTKDTIIEEITKIIVPEENQVVSIELNQDSLLKLLYKEDELEIETEHEKENTNGKWQIGAAVSPQISYRDVASPDMMQNTAANNSESAKMTYAGGVQVRFKQSDRLTFEAGIYYNKMGVNIGEYSNFKSWRSSSLDLTDAAPSNVVSLSNSMGTIKSGTNSSFVNNYSQLGAVEEYDLLSPEELKLQNSIVNSFTQSFEYLEIPFNLRYKIVDKAFKVQLIGGLSTNFLVNNSITAITDEERINIGEVQDIRSVNYSGNAGLGFVYEFMNNLSLSVEPRFRYYLNSINASYLPATRPYTFGLYTGLNYTF
ncbi:MAG: outer membrane beta-barrel protein [Bacteroidales bacterium]|jgi:hypothetical protein|nr:outer membrane beta-barrel protein [Bacteroidales bacterium]